MASKHKINIGRDFPDDSRLLISCESCGQLPGVFGTRAEAERAGKSHQDDQEPQHQNAWTIGQVRSLVRKRGQVMVWVQIDIGNWVKVPVTKSKLLWSLRGYSSDRMAFAFRERDERGGWVTTVGDRGERR